MPGPSKPQNQVEYDEDDPQSGDLAANKNFTSSNAGCQQTGCAECNQPPPGTEVAVLCQIICDCDKNPPLGVQGQSLRQSCVKRKLWTADDAMGSNSRLKAEVPYDMSPVPPAPPKPIMSAWNNKRATRKPRAGSSIPDVVVVRSGCEPPVQSNIAAVYEIKFPPDYDSRNKEADYRRIAGTAPFGFLSPDEPPCECRKKQPETVPVPAPVPAPEQEPKKTPGWVLPAAAIGLAIVSALLLQPEGEVGAAALWEAAFGSGL